MEKKDILLVYLRRNARETLTQVSKETKIPISTLYDRLKSYEKSVIKKHTTLVDFQKMGYGCRAHILLKCPRDQKDALKDALLKHNCVNTVFKINNGYDYLFEGVFLDMQHMESFMDRLESKYVIEEKQIHFIIEDISRESFLSNPELVI